MGQPCGFYYKDYDVIQGIKERRSLWCVVIKTYIALYDVVFLPKRPLVLQLRGGVQSTSFIAFQYNAPADEA